MSSSLGPAGIVGGGVQCSIHLQYHDGGALEQGIELPNAPRVPQHKWLPTALGVCVFSAVCALHLPTALCVNLQSTNSEYGSPYLAVCHITFMLLLNSKLIHSSCAPEVALVLQRKFKPFKDPT